MTKSLRLMFTRGSENHLLCNKWGNSCLCKLLFITLPVILRDQGKVIWSLGTINNWRKLCHFIYLFHLNKDIAFANYVSKTLTLCSQNLLSRGKIDRNANKIWVFIKDMGYLGRSWERRLYLNWDLKNE